MLDGLLSQTFAEQHVGRYTSAGVADGAGIAMIASDVVCLVLAIGFAVPALRARRLAFWIPVVCAAIGALVTAALAVIAAVVDPAFGAYVARQR